MAQEFTMLAARREPSGCSEYNLQIRPGGSRRSAKNIIRWRQSKWH
ncbi:hypothetical protein RMSM_04763 [Rhodopirellula maiorica SM1]|uniref:Uncharacterized protein n=1 Tax=Rhodopirellula maiorica SM1 TaxID=1265738 RepID=M5RG62_9BACT|nr:hypothetical protein RMSM_04763 [Rhodopirellula maiorica SM1]